MRRFLALAIALVVAGTACQDTTTPKPSISFTISSPLCGTQHFNFQFVIDGELVGQEELSNGQLSKAYSVDFGTHAVAAKIASATTNLFEGAITVEQTLGSVVVTVPVFCS